MTIFQGLQDYDNLLGSAYKGILVFTLIPIYTLAQQFSAIVRLYPSYAVGIEFPIERLFTLIYPNLLVRSQRVLATIIFPSSFLKSVMVLLMYTCRVYASLHVYVERVSAFILCIFSQIVAIYPSTQRTRIFQDTISKEYHLHHCHVSKTLIAKEPQCLNLF